jgi:hypothetical protein
MWWRLGRIDFIDEIWGQSIAIYILRSFPLSWKPKNGWVQTFCEVAQRGAEIARENWEDIILQNLEELSNGILWDLTILRLNRVEPKVANLWWEWHLSIASDWKISRKIFRCFQRLSIACRSTFERKDRISVFVVLWQLFVGRYQRVKSILTCDVKEQAESQFDFRPSSIFASSFFRWTRIILRPFIKCHKQSQ